MSVAATTVPCKYKTGKTLGKGTYAVVKEAVHIETGKRYAVKVINKMLMRGREEMIRNEIAIQRRISVGHPNILTLVDYFETYNNLYLVTDLAEGGELFDRICMKGSYYEHDAAQLVATICRGVGYLHEQHIVHRDLKPENLLFRTTAEDSELLIADFGLSRIIDQEKFHALTTKCGTPGYMAPEIFQGEGHGTPVDMWALGVITYFLLCGYTPFDRQDSVDEIAAISRADYKFEPAKYWADVSDTAKDFVTKLLTVDPLQRMTAKTALQHPWLIQNQPQSNNGSQPLGQTNAGYNGPPNHSNSGNNGSGHYGEQGQDLLPRMREKFNARKAFRKAVGAVVTINTLQTLRAQIPEEVDEVLKRHDDDVEMTMA